MHHRVRLRGRDQVGECFGVGEIDESPFDVASTQFTPAFDTTLHGRDRDERRGAALEIPATANEIVHRDDSVALAGQVHRLRPAEIAVRAEHDHRSVAHARSSWEWWDPATFGKKTLRRSYGLDYAYTIRPLAIRHPHEMPECGCMSVPDWPSGSTRRRTKERQSAFRVDLRFCSPWAPAPGGDHQRRHRPGAPARLAPARRPQRPVAGDQPFGRRDRARGPRRRLLPGRSSMAIRRPPAQAAGQLARAARRHRRVVGSRPAPSGPSADVTFVALARTRFAVGVARGSGSAIVARILDVVSLALVAVVASFFTSHVEPTPVILVAVGAFVAGLGVLLSLIIPGRGPW